MTQEPDPPTRVAPPDGGTPEHCAIVLHGLGADGHDLAPLARQLPAAKAFSFVFPHAPFRPITVNGGMTMRGWYDIAGVDLRAREDADGIAESERAVREIIRDEIGRGTAPGKIFLAGFSQGGALALHTGLRFPERLAGIACLSGYVPLAGRLKGEMAPWAGEIPVFMAHGTRDPIVPVEAAHASRDLLAELGVNAEYREYPIDHTISLEEGEALNGWIGRVCAAARQG